MVKTIKRKSIKRRRQRAGGPRFSFPQKKSPESNNSVSNNKTRKKKKVQFNESDELHEDDPRDSDEFYTFKKTDKKTPEEILRDEAIEQGITNEKQINAYIEEHLEQRKINRKNQQKERKNLIRKKNILFQQRKQQEDKQNYINEFIQNYKKGGNVKKRKHT